MPPREMQPVAIEWRGERFDPVDVIRAVNHLHALGAASALSMLEQCVDVVAPELDVDVMAPKFAELKGDHGSHGMSDACNSDSVQTWGIISVTRLLFEPTKPIASDFIERKPKWNGRIWIRVGPRRATANEQEEQILIERRRAGNLPWDLQPIEPATTGDLDLDLFQREYLPSAVRESQTNCF